MITTTTTRRPWADAAKLLSRSVTTADGAPPSVTRLAAPRCEAGGRAPKDSPRSDGGAGGRVVTSSRKGSGHASRRLAVAVRAFISATALAASRQADCCVLGKLSSSGTRRMQISVLRSDRLPTLTIASINWPCRYVPPGISPTATVGRPTSTNSFRAPGTSLAVG